MNRAERRQKERSAKAFERRQTFSKQEFEKANEAAYNMGVQHTLEAMKIALQIGPKRRAKVMVELLRLQHRDFVEFFEEIDKK